MKTETDIRNIVVTEHVAIRMSDDNIDNLDSQMVHIIGLDCNTEYVIHWLGNDNYIFALTVS